MSNRKKPLKPWLSMSPVEKKARDFANVFNPPKRKVNRRRHQMINRRANVVAYVSKLPSKTAE